MRIAAVHQQPSGLWLVTDDKGQKYATKNDRLVAQAREAVTSGAPVSILSLQGWFYRELQAVHIITQREHAS